jgi:hypothetical protein
MLKLKNIFIILLLIKKYINSVEDYKYEICSYNGKPNINKSNNEITCECKPQFTNDTKYTLLINNEPKPTYCSYKKKSKLKTIFFACIIPFGLDYYYMDYIFLPYLIFIINFLIIIINIYYINKLIIIDKKINNNGIIEQKYKKILKKWNYFIISIDIFLIIEYLLNIILISCNIIKDKNGFPLYNDIFFFRN